MGMRISRVTCKVSTDLAEAMKELKIKNNDKAI
jgi:hypothetical protein